MIKVTVKAAADGRMRVVIEGRLEGEGIAALAAVCDAAGGELDVQGLRGADEAGWRVLRRLKASGWTVVGASLFAAGMLEEASS